ncbi:MAG: hypothetical protein OER43_15720 [Gammaproteobacteria bacterium]|nr:hypothetical protein [Gammaproteobacteria bacterium]
MGQPFLRDVSIREAVSRDLVSFLTEIFLLFVILCLVLAIVYVGWLGGPPMRESPSEILLGFLLITGFVVAVLRFRASRITETLRNGNVVPAEVLRGFQHQYFVTLLVKYTVQGKVIQKQVWLPNTKRPRALVKEERVFLAVRLDKPKAIVVRDLYMK